MSTINRIGTTFFGCSEPKRDGSFITTKWLIFLIPIVPLGSYRVLPLSSTNLLFYASTEYESQAVPLYWQHVFKMYATYLAAALLFYATDLLSGPRFNQKVSSPFLASFIAVTLSIFAINISSFIRKGSTYVNLIVLALIMMFSFMVAGNISAKPDTTLNYMYLLWGAYIAYIVNSFLKDENASDKEKREIGGKGKRG